MFEELVTYGAVIGAATYAMWRLMPGVLRLALAEHCATLAQRLGLAQADAEAPHRRASARGSGGCGGCTGCGKANLPQSVAIINNKDVKGS